MAGWKCMTCMGGGYGNRGVTPCRAQKWAGDLGGAARSPRFDVSDEAAGVERWGLPTGANEVEGAAGVAVAGADVNACSSTRGRREEEEEEEEEVEQEEEGGREDTTECGGAWT